MLRRSPRCRNAVPRSLGLEQRGEIAQRELRDVDHVELESRVLDELDLLLDEVGLGRDGVHHPVRAAARVARHLEHVDDCVVDVKIDEVLDAPAHGGAQLLRGHVGGLDEQQMVADGVEHAHGRTAPARQPAHDARDRVVVAARLAAGHNALSYAQHSSRGLRPGGDAPTCATATPSAVTNTPSWLPVRRARLNNDSMLYRFSIPIIRAMLRARDRRSRCAGIELNPSPCPTPEKRVSVPGPPRGFGGILRRTSNGGGRGAAGLRGAAGGPRSSAPAPGGPGDGVGILDRPRRHVHRRRRARAGRCVAGAQAALGNPAHYADAAVEGIRRGARARPARAARRVADRGRKNGHDRRDQRAARAAAASRRRS